MASTKNQMLTASAISLGMGDQLRQQVDDSVDEIRKKKLKQAGVIGEMSAAGQSLFQGAGSYSI